SNGSDSETAGQPKRSNRTCRHAGRFTSDCARRSRSLKARRSNAQRWSAQPVPTHARSSVARRGHNLVSSTAALAGSCSSSCAIEGKRSVKSCPLPLKMRTREPHLVAWTRWPSNFTSCTQSSPAGTLLAVTGLQGTMKQKLGTASGFSGIAAAGQPALVACYRREPRHAEWHGLERHKVQQRHARPPPALHTLAIASAAIIDRRRPSYR